MKTDPRTLSPDTEFRTYEVRPAAGKAFPDLDMVMYVDGARWDKYGAAYDGKLWRISLYQVPKTCSVEIRRNDGTTMESRRVGKNDNMERNNDA